jgi:hypothetical protein
MEEDKAFVGVITWSDVHTLAKWPHSSGLHLLGLKIQLKDNSP